MFVLRGPVPPFFELALPERQPPNLAAIDRDASARSGVNLPRKLLFFAVGTHISPTIIFQTLADLGARDGMLLDGGDSSSMAIGTGASVVSPGAVHGWRPVANQFGVRAQPLR